MQKETLNDAGFIVDNILRQPLFVIGTSGEVTLLSAAEEFLSNGPHSSNLGKVLFSFIEYPGPTENLMTELELISHDLEAGLEE